MEELDEDELDDEELRDNELEDEIDDELEDSELALSLDDEVLAITELDDELDETGTEELLLGCCDSAPPQDARARETAHTYNGRFTTPPRLRRLGRKSIPRIIIDVDKTTPDKLLGAPVDVPIFAKRTWTQMCELSLN